jgi:hypothetical protein
MATTSRRLYGRGMIYSNARRKYTYDNVSMAHFAQMNYDKCYRRSTHQKRSAMYRSSDAFSHHRSTSTTLEPSGFIRTQTGVQEAHARLDGPLLVRNSASGAGAHFHILRWTDYRELCSDSSRLMMYHRRVSHLLALFELYSSTSSKCRHV